MSQNHSTLGAGTSSETRRWHGVIIGSFIVQGFVSASILVRFPQVTEMLGITTAELGVLLFVGAVGSLLALSLIGRFISVRGTRIPVVWGTLILILALIVEAVSIQSGSTVGYGIGLFIAGFAVGAADVGINVDGAEIESRRGRSTLPRLHAAYSVGTLVGAGVGTLSMVVGFPLVAQVTVLAALSLVVPVLGFLWEPDGIGREVAATDDSSKAGSGRGLSFVSPSLVFLGLGIFGMTLAEGASNDWLALTFSHSFGQSDTIAGLSYVALLVTISAVRFWGGAWADRFGRVATLRALALMGIAGLLTIALSVDVPIAFVGVVLWGAGVALAFPLFISAAGEMPNPARTVAFVTTCGYAAFLVGPPLLGFVGHAIGMSNMLWVITAFLAVSFVTAGAARRR
ncbi:MAG: hypothetical protein RIS25_873 [Actinomycetota bacterium]